MYTFKTRPYEHQREALRRSRGKPGYGFLMEMGTGKTKVIIDEIGLDYTDGEIDTAVIFAPKGVYRNWIRELEVHLGIPHRKEYWVSGGGNKQQQKALSQLCSPDEKRLRILVMNIEAVSTRGTATKFLEKFLESGRYYMAVDESTTIKGPTSKRTKYIISVGRRAERRRIATGSPAPNSPLDLFSQFDFLQPSALGHRSFWNFKNRYAVQQQKIFGGRKVQVVVGYRNIKELTEEVQKHSYRVLKEECLDLPDKVYRVTDVDLTDEQTRIYRDLKNEAYAEFEGGFTSSTNAITTLMRLQQVVCGHIRDADGNIHRVKSSRVETLMQELEGVRGACIIWSRFRPEIDDIAEAIRKNYGEESLAQYHGGNTDSREEEARRYIDSDRCRFMLSTQQSGGYGNTWLKGTNTFYVSNSFNLEHRLQSEDRPHRSGQTEKCTYTDLRALGTVDERLIRALRNKISIAETILGDEPREWLM